MTDRQAFMASIIADPLNDAPRLVFADFLEENGEPERAELIRLQIELAGIDVRPMDPVIYRSGKINALRRRESELYTGDGSYGPFTNAWRWLDEPRNRDGSFWYPNGADWSRGFVEVVVCSWQDWLAHHATITAATPLRRVRLTSRPNVETRTNPVGLRLVGCSAWRSNLLREWDVNGGQPLITAALLRAEWPGIAFELPAERGLIFTSDTTSDDGGGRFRWTAQSNS